MMPITASQRREPNFEGLNGSTLLQYTVQQYLIMALHLIGLWKRPWFDDRFPNDPYMPRLLIGVCAGGEDGRLLSLTEAAKLMEVADSRTANRCVDRAVDLGLLDRLDKKETQDDKVDKRRVVLKPTPRLIDLVKQELAKVADEMRNATAAMLKDGQQLPETGAAHLTLAPPGSDTLNRRAQNYAERASVRARHSCIGWGT